MLRRKCRLYLSATQQEKDRRDRQRQGMRTRTKHGQSAYTDANRYLSHRVMLENPGGDW